MGSLLQGYANIKRGGYPKRICTGYPLGMFAPVFQDFRFEIKDDLFRYIL